jgi:hypothetical protein
MSTPSPDDYKQILLDAQLAFHRGDFAGVKRRLEPMLDRQPPADVRDDACKLLAAVRHDKPALWLLGGCALFFVFVVLQYVV